MVGVVDIDDELIIDVVVITGIDDVVGGDSGSDTVVIRGVLGLSGCTDLSLQLPRHSSLE